MPKTLTGAELDLDDGPARESDLFIVDGNNLAYRAFFALPEELATTDGQPTNALLGFTNMLFKLLADYRPKGVAVAWDSRPVERHAAFLEGTSSPPVGALAKAAASLKEKRAVGLLVAQLKDPGTRSTDLPALVAALGELGDASAAEALADFLRLYHADPIDEHLLRALELVPDALVKLNGPVAQPVDRQPG